MLPYVYQFNVEGAINCRSNHSWTFGKEFRPAWNKAITRLSFYKQKGYCKKSYWMKTFGYRVICHWYLLLGANKKYRWRVSLKNIEWNGNETKTCTCSLTGSYFLMIPSFPLGYLLLTINKGMQSAKGGLTIVISLTLLPRYNAEA